MDKVTRAGRDAAGGPSPGTRPATRKGPVRNQLEPARRPA